MAKIMRPDGTVTTLSPPEDADGCGYTLEEVQDALGLSRDDLIQELPISRTEAMLMDENAKVKRDASPINMPATHYARMHGSLFAGDFIVGTVLLVSTMGGDWR